MGARAAVDRVLAESVAPVLSDTIRREARDTALRVAADMRKAARAGGFSFSDDAILETMERAGFRFGSVDALKKATRRARLAGNG